MIKFLNSPWFWIGFLKSIIFYLNKITMLFQFVMKSCFVFNDFNFFWCVFFLFNQIPTIQFKRFWILWLIESYSWRYIFKVNWKVLFNSLFINSASSFWKIEAVRLFYVCKKSIIRVFSLFSNDIFYPLDSCWFQTLSFNFAKSHVIVSRLEFKMINKFYSIIVNVFTLSKMSWVHRSIGVVSWNYSSKVCFIRFLLDGIWG